jgi:hypothetical protein
LVWQRWPTEAEKIRAEEATRQKRVADGTTKINQLFDKQFNPAFFKKQSTNYTNTRCPSWRTSTRTPPKQLTFALDRRGRAR